MRRLQRAAGVAFFALAPLAAVLGGQALPPLQTLTAPWGLGPTAMRTMARSNASWLLALLAALAWTALSALWSPTPDAGLRALKLLGVVAVALGFLAARTADAEARALTARLALFAALGLAVLCALEALSGLALNRLAQPAEQDLVKLMRNPGKGVSVLLLLVFPAVLSAQQRSPLLALLLGLGALALGLAFGQAVNAAGWAAGALAAAVCWMAPRLGLWLCGLVWAGWLLAAPFLLGALQPMLAAAPTSWEMRGAIWRYAAARIAEKPWLGWGLEASRGFDGVHVVDGVAIPSISLHPHSASLQIWLELGGVGAVLWSGALLLGARTGAQLLGADRARAAAAGGAAAVAFVLWNLSYGAWQEWLWAAAAAGAAAALSTPAAAQQPRTVLAME